MTETRRWLEVYRFRLARVDVASAVLLTAGVVLGALALGQLLGNAGLYVRVPSSFIATVPCSAAPTAITDRGS